MTVDLRPITAENFRDVIKLEVRPEQSGFVAPNVLGIAETHIYPEAEPRAVYAGDELVGFVLFTASTGISPPRGTASCG